MLVLLAASVFAALPGKWPKIDAPVNEVPEWTEFFLGGKTIPALAVTQAQLPGPLDWSEDITRCVNADDWGLTYDDGPGPFTQGVLDALQQRGNTLATFFVIGSRVYQNPELVRKAYSQGHQIAIHTWSHPALTTMTNGQIVAQIVYTSNAIKAAIGKVPTYFRCPCKNYLFSWRY